MFCTKCGARLSDGATFCTNCGATVEHDSEQVAQGVAAQQTSSVQTSGPVQTTCPVCGAPVTSDMAFCTNCGERLDAFGASFGANASTGSAAAPNVTLGASPSPEQTPYIPGSGFDGVDERARKDSESNAPLVTGIVIGIVAVALVSVVALHYFGLMGDPEFLSFLPMANDAATATVASNSSGRGSSSSSTSSTTKSVSVPTVTGLSQSEAEQQLRNAGLTVGNVTTQKSASDAGTVVSQSVTGSAEKGSAIDLVVSAQKQKVFSVIHQAKTWDEARTYCEEQGGQLASISSSDEWNQVIQLLEADGHSVYWIGAQRSGSGWSWVDGSDFSYTHWAAGEPNNEDGIENVIAIDFANGVYNMYDEPNDVSSFYAESKLGFVMEKYE